MGCRTSTPHLSDMQRAVLAALDGSGDDCSSRDIAAASGLKAQQVSCQLTALRKKGLINSPARCRYEITADGKKALS